ncbi:MAG TPA: type III pantothenate kinase, partial [Actinomycetota bacterium]|nr:type III pantothenate kinase [Actinomycetota bacterium]
MLLAIDVGNTETVVGVFRDADLAWRWRMATVPNRTADELALLFGGFLGQQGLSFDRNVTGVIVSSVVPGATQALREMVRRYFGFPPVIVEPGVKTGVAILIDNPKEVGADRIVNSLAAFTRFGGPAVVVDGSAFAHHDRCQAARGDHRRLAELLGDPLDHPVDHRRVAEDQAR